MTKYTTDKVVYTSPPPNHGRVGTGQGQKSNKVTDEPTDWQTNQHCKFQRSMSATQNSKNYNIVNEMYLNYSASQFQSTKRDGLGRRCQQRENSTTQRWLWFQTSSANVMSLWKKRKGSFLKCKLASARGYICRLVNQTVILLVLHTNVQTVSPNSAWGGGGNFPNMP